MSAGGDTSCERTVASLSLVRCASHNPFNFQSIIPLRWKHAQNLCMGFCPRSMKMVDRECGRCAGFAAGDRGVVRVWGLPLFPSPCWDLDFGLLFCCSSCTPYLLPESQVRLDRFDSSYSSNSASLCTAASNAAACSTIAASFCCATSANASSRWDHAASESGECSPVASERPRHLACLRPATATGCSVAFVFTDSC